MDIGIKALNTNPRKTEKKNVGEKNVILEFGGVRFIPGDYLVADMDGVVLLKSDLKSKLWKKLQRFINLFIIDIIIYEIIQIYFFIIVTDN